jgi:hypothetical protein
MMTSAQVLGIKLGKAWADFHFQTMIAHISAIIKRRQPRHITIEEAGDLKLLFRGGYSAPSAENWPQMPI